ncbi:MAG: helix-turn-helix domain-containing protein [Candidatus Diapherotrites archaeon]|nr:helix-turn-helix domain-containing protein [Candidatus Diapherotrites archaeon]
MNNKLFEDIGLTPGEVKVYFALLKLGTTKTGKLAVQANVSSSKVYKILARLEMKGLVGHILKGEVKYFSANAPRRILDYVDEKENFLHKKKALIEEMLPELEKQKLSLGKTTATVYEGFNGVTNFFKNILSDLKPGETYYVIGAGYGDNIPGLQDFFYTHHAKRVKRKIKVKLLANHDVKKSLVSTTKKNSEIRFLPQYLITNTEIVFYKNKVFIALFTHEPTGFLIESEEAVKSFQSYFNVFWKIAKP